MKHLKRKAGICYLCGKALGNDRTRDHVPPKQFYAKEIRNGRPLQLFTLPAHGICNEAYKHDEDYFVSSLGPLARESYSGRALWSDLKRNFSRPRGRSLLSRIHGEFGNLILPGSKVFKTVDRRRVERILWKILSGLYFKEMGKILPGNMARAFLQDREDEEPDEYLKYLLGSPSHGDYPGVFDYKFLDETQVQVCNAWAFLLWDRLIFFILFHRTDCRCELCCPPGKLTEQ